MYKYGLIINYNVLSIAKIGRRIITAETERRSDLNNFKIAFDQRLCASAVITLLLPVINIQ